MTNPKDDESFGEMLIEGLREALAIARGEMEPARISVYPIPEASPPSPPAED
jgi:hypothetical protein